MGPANSDADSVLEILDAGSCAYWLAAPGKLVEYPISIRNGTQDSHDIEVSVADPIDWVKVKPGRVALAPGSETMTTLLVEIPLDAQVAAGQHNITLELHDFEGTCFGQLVSSLNVEPVYRIEMAVVVRAPLVHRDVVEGFVIHCTLVNRGNTECAVETIGESDGCVILHAPTVRVPMGGEVTFDIEARWTSDALRSYPSAIGVRAVSPQGETRAEIGWAEIVKCLGPYIPPLREEEEFPDIIPWRAQRALEEDPANQTLRSTVFPPDSAMVNASASTSTASTDTSAASAPTPHAPIRVQINGPSPFRSSFGRRINPWWPPIEQVGSKRRIKPAPFAIALMLAVLAGLLSNLTVPARNKLVPAIGFASLLRVPPQGQTIGPPRSIVAVRQQPKAGHGQPHSTSHQTYLPSLPAAQSAAQAPHTKGAHVASAPHVGTPKGSVWQGPVVHVSAGNVKVYSTADKSVRSFIVTPGFKSVYTGDGAHAASMSDVRVGSVVRVYYSYTFGIRHPNAIFVIRQAY